MAQNLPDAGQYAGLLSRWHGTNRHVPVPLPATTAGDSADVVGELEPGDIRSLAARADRLWATHRPQSHDLVANVDTAEEQLAQIAAVQRKEPSQKKKKFAGKKFGGRPSAAAGGQATAASGSGSGSGSDAGGLTHSEQARVGSGLCYFHWTHRAKANKCVAPAHGQETRDLGAA